MLPTQSISAIAPRSISPLSRLDLLTKSDKSLAGARFIKAIKAWNRQLSTSMDTVHRIHNVDVFDSKIREEVTLLKQAFSTQRGGLDEPGICRVFYQTANVAVAGCFSKGLPSHAILSDLALGKVDHRYTDSYNDLMLKLGFAGRFAFKLITDVSGTTSLMNEFLQEQGTDLGVGQRRESPSFFEFRQPHKIVPIEQDRAEEMNRTVYDLEQVIRQEADQRRSEAEQRLQRGIEDLGFQSTVLDARGHAVRQDYADNLRQATYDRLAKELLVVKSKEIRELTSQSNDARALAHHNAVERANAIQLM